MDKVDSAAFPEKLPALLLRTKQMGFQMACEERTGALLRILATSKPGGHFLEIGTGTGVGTTWLLDGMDSTASLVSVEIDQTFQEVARQAFGGDCRLTLCREDAGIFLKRQLPLSFDLVFADAIPSKYEFLSTALLLVRKGGFYVVDDLLPQENWPPGHAEKVPALMRELSSHTDFKCVKMAWASGLIVLARQK